MENYSKPKFQLGKIKSKYLIVEILGFCSESSDCVLLILYKSCKLLRILLIENFRWIERNITNLFFSFLIKESKCCFDIEGVSFLKKSFPNIK